jgi:methionyl-tRNA formyltransferase
MTLIFCAYRDWALELYEKIVKKFPDMILVSSPKQLTLNFIKSKNPKYIFFPDWSWIVPKEIIESYSCICFHESNLPKFRGGSPLQNQIFNGINKTKSTAFIMDEGLDSGDIILQKNLSLSGTIYDIFDRIILNDYEMTLKIISGDYKKKKQKGKPTIFKRRIPEQSELKNLNNPKKQIYDFIRMLGDPYPNAFFKVGKHKIIFKSARFDGKKLTFDGEID